MDQHISESKPNCEPSSAATEVLAISDEPIYSSTITEPVPRYKPCNFPTDFLRRARQLLLEKSSASKDDNYDVEMFAVRRRWATRYSQEYIFSSYDPEQTYIFWGPTLNAKAVLRVVKLKLKDENWTSENVIEKKFQSKIDGAYDYTRFDEYIVKLVIDILHEDQKHVWHFVNSLQRMHKMQGGT